MFVSCDGGSATWDTWLRLARIVLFCKPPCDYSVIGIINIQRIQRDDFFLDVLEVYFLGLNRFSCYYTKQCWCWYIFSSQYNSAVFTCYKTDGSEYDYCNLFNTRDETSDRHFCPGEFAGRGGSGHMRWVLSEIMSQKWDGWVTYGRWPKNIVSPAAVIWGMAVQKPGLERD